MFGAEEFQKFYFPRGRENYGTNTESTRFRRISARYEAGIAFYIGSLGMRKFDKLERNCNAREEEEEGWNDAYPMIRGKEKQ